MTFFSNVQYDLIRIFDNTVINLEKLKIDEGKGSNGWAISPTLSTDNKTRIVVNSHQPLRGFASWYEVHVNSHEGWNFYGATLCGGVTPFVGTNENLGWTHTVNYEDFHDVFRLEMHPAEKNKYKFDGQWLDLEERTLRLKVKLGPIKLPIKRKFFWSKYGATLKNDDGYYALRFPSNMVIHAAEQWFQMNKAQNLNEFKAAMDMQGMICFNTIYGDKDGNILFVGNGLFPYRNPDKKYNWHSTLPGNTSETLWEPKFMPMDSLIVVENPECGYIYNMNNSAFHCTCPEENPDPNDFNHTMGYQELNTARAVRFKEIIQNYDKISYEDLKEIKYDSKYSFPLYTRSIQNLDVILHLSKEEHPEIADIIDVLAKWNGDTDKDNMQAAILSLAVQHIISYNKKTGLGEQNNALPKHVFIDALVFAKKHLLKHFGSLEIPLGNLQKHVRGNGSTSYWLDTGSNYTDVYGRMEKRYVPKLPW